MRHVLVILPALIFGLILAVAIEGRLGHLRQVAGDRLPGWTAALPDDVGPWHGQVILAAQRLSWRFARIGADGIVWQLRSDGPAGTVTGKLALAGRVGVVQDLVGVIDLAAFGYAEPGGQLVLEQGRVTFDWFTNALGAGEITGRMQEVHLEGHDLGGGPARLVLAADGQWQARADLAGGVMPVVLTLTGRLGTGQAEAVAEITDSADLPPGWRNALGLLATRNDERWILRQTIPLAPGTLSGR